MAKWNRRQEIRDRARDRARKFILEGGSFPKLLDAYAAAVLDEVIQIKHTYELEGDQVKRLARVNEWIAKCSKARAEPSGRKVGGNQSQADNAYHGGLVE